MADLVDFTDDPDFALVPPDDVARTAEEILDAAELSALEADDGLLIETDAVLPYGRTWAFDFATGRFKTGPNGSAPLEVNGTESLQVWLETLAATAAGVHSSLPPDFGLDDPAEFIGFSDPIEGATDFAEQFTEAAVALHDRVGAIEDFTPEWEQGSDTVTISNFTVITDDGDAIELEPFNAEPEI